MSNSPWDFLMAFILDLKERLKEESPKLGSKFENLLTEIVVLAKECGYDQVGKSLHAAEKAVKLTRFLSKNMEAIVNIDRYYNPYIEECNICKLANSDAFESELKRVDPHLYEIFREKKLAALKNMPDFPIGMGRTELTKGVFHAIVSKNIDPYRREPSGGYVPSYTLPVGNPLTDDIPVNNYYLYEGRIYIRISLEPYRLVGAIDTANGLLYVSDIVRRRSVGWEEYNFKDRKALPIHEEIFMFAVEAAMVRNRSTYLNEAGVVTLRPVQRSSLEPPATKLQESIARKFVNDLNLKLTTYEKTGIAINLFKDSFTVLVGTDDRGNIVAMGDTARRILQFRYTYLGRSHYDNLWKVDEIIKYGIVSFDNYLFPFSGLVDKLSPDQITDVVVKLKR